MPWFGVYNHLCRPIFKWKLYFQSKVLGNFWFDQNLVGKSLLVTNLRSKLFHLLDLQDSIFIFWILNATVAAASRPHYSVFSFHLYSNCGFLALTYIYSAIWCLLPYPNMCYKKIELVYLIWLMWMRSSEFFSMLQPIYSKFQVQDTNRTEQRKRSKSQCRGKESQLWSWAQRW